MGVDPHGQTTGEASLCRAVANQSIQIKEQSIMKLIFGFLLFVAAVAITGGLYLAIRKPEKKKTDLEKLESACCQTFYRIRQLDDYLARIYTTAFFRMIPSSRKERSNVSEKQSSGSDLPHDSGVIPAE
jgi:hypothetical protein